MKPIFLLLFTTIFISTTALADEMDSPFLRLKTGINYPEANSDVSHFTPIAFDGIYPLSNNFGIGLHALYATGNHSIAQLQGINLALFNLSKTMVLALASGDYFFKFGSARIDAGIKAGALFYSDRTTLAAGIEVPDTTNSKTLFTAGPSLDIDLPLKGDVFVNLGGDYMISQSSYNFGSLYVGLGINF